MSKIIGWNIQILDNYDQTPEVKIIDAIPDKCKFVFVTCRSWEEAEEAKARIEQEEQEL